MRRTMPGGSATRELAARSPGGACPSAAGLNAHGYLSTRKRSVTAASLSAMPGMSLQSTNATAGRAGSSQGRHYRESLFWAVRSFESRSGHRAHPRGACDHGRPRAAPRQTNARSWERHFQRRDASGVIALLERLLLMSSTFVND